MADGDFTAAFPWFTEGAPDSYRVAAEWARDQIGDERRGLPAPPALGAPPARSTTTLILFCHASPGSLTDGLPADLDPVVTIDRVEPDRRQGHRLRPHPPARGPRGRLANDRQRRQRRLRLRRRPDGQLGAHRDRRDGSQGRDPAHRATTSWRRRTRSPRAACRATCTRRHNPHGEACPMSSYAQPRVVVTGMGAVTALGLDVAATWDGLVAGRSGVGHDHAVRSVAPDHPHRRRGQGLRSLGRPRPQGAAAQRPLRPVRARGRPPGDGPGRAARRDWKAELAERTGVMIGTGIGGIRTLADQVLLMGERGPGPHVALPDPDGHQQPRGRRDRPSSSARRAPTSASSPPAPPAATPSARPGRSIRRGDADMMLAGGSEATMHESLVGGFAAMRRSVHPQRRARAGIAPLRPAPRRLRHRRGLRRRRPGVARPRPQRAASSRWPRWSATAPRPTPRTSLCRRPAARAPSGPSVALSRRPA